MVEEKNMQQIVGWGAILLLLASCGYAILEADIAREIHQGPLQTRALKLFLKRRMILPSVIIICCLILIWMVFVH
jgi:hypothetical protein